MTVSVTSQARLEFRIGTAQKDVIERAAEVLGLNLSQFAIATLVERARKVLDEDEVTVLSNRDRDIFLRMLDEDAQPNAALRKAARHYRKNQDRLREYRAR